MVTAAPLQARLINHLTLLLDSKRQRWVAQCLISELLAKVTFQMSRLTLVRCQIVIKARTTIMNAALFLREDHISRIKYRSVRVEQHISLNRNDLKNAPDLSSYLGRVLAPDQDHRPATRTTSVIDIINNTVLHLSEGTQTENLRLKLIELTMIIKNPMVTHLAVLNSTTSTTLTVGFLRVTI